MIDILIWLLVPALRWEADKWGRWYLTPLAFVAWVADIIAAHTAWALATGWPKPYELTISHTLERLVKTPGPDQQLYIEIAKKINRVARAQHIKGV